MFEPVVRMNACRLCDGQNLELIMQFAPTPPGDHYVSAENLEKVQETYPLDLYFCSDCGHSQLGHAVNPDILYRDYIYETSISLGLVEHFDAYARRVIDRTKPSKGSLVVDIGSNDGTLLKAYQRRGMRVLGIDPAISVAKKASDSGIETIPDFFSVDLAQKIRVDHGPASIINANNVIANIYDLTGLVEGIRHLLAPDGIFVFETGYVVDLVQQTIIDNVYHEHLYYYAVKPLENFFRRYGLELIYSEHVQTKGGSLRGIVQLAGGPRKRSTSVSDLMSSEESIGTDRAETFKAMARQVEGVKVQLVNLLHKIKAQGKSVAGYGASVGVTTLLYYFDVAGLVELIVDDNPARHNLYTPGHHIPVFSSQKIYERKPDYIIIWAWRYAEPIMEKHPSYIHQGGHFILPLPDVKVI